MRHAPRSKQRGWLNFVIPAVASLAGGMLANKSNEGIAEDTSNFNAAQAAINRTFNAEEAAKARDFSAAQAARAMDFSEEMSNTSWQRGVKDMQAAGLNPMLAFSQGGASTPTGIQGSPAQASGSAASGVAATMKDVITPAIASAQQFRAVNAQIQNTEAQTDVARAQRDNIAQDTINKGTQSDQIVATTENIKEGTKQISAQTNLTEKQAEKVIQDVKESYSREDLNKVEAILKRLSISEAKAFEKFYSGLGEYSPEVRFVIGILRSITGR